MALGFTLPEDPPPPGTLEFHGPKDTTIDCGQQGYVTFETADGSPLTVHAAVTRFHKEQGYLLTLAVQNVVDVGRPGCLATLVNGRLLDYKWNNPPFRFVVLGYFSPTPEFALEELRLYVYP